MAEQASYRVFPGEPDDWRDFISGAMKVSRSLGRDEFEAAAYLTGRQLASSLLFQYDVEHGTPVEAAHAAWKTRRGG